MFGRNITRCFEFVGENLDNTASKKESIAIIGGTGKEGRGLAYRWAKAGYPVTIGSRSIDKAIITRNEIAGFLKKTGVHSFELFNDENLGAVSKCDIAVLTVPYEFHDETLLSLRDALQGKFLLDVTVPLIPPKVTSVVIPPDGSIARHAQIILGEKVRVISAFQNISFELLLSSKSVQCEVLVCGVDEESRRLGLRLVKDAGMIGWDAGPLENSIVQEGLTSILIRINKTFGVNSSGIKIIGVKQEKTE